LQSLSQITELLIVLFQPTVLPVDVIVAARASPKQFCVPGKLQFLRHRYTVTLKLALEVVEIILVARSARRVRSRRCLIGLVEGPAPNWPGRRAGPDGCKHDCKHRERFLRGCSH